MFSFVIMTSFLHLAFASTVPVTEPRASYNATCNAVAAVISPASAVFYPGSALYKSDTEHWVASSIQQSACTVEPGTAADVAAILKVLAKTDTPFGIKGGGHMANPTFSSTKGVHIAMSRFNSVKYHRDTQTVSFGSGITWDIVFEALEPYNVTVAGGRIIGVGVGGYLLGGGYSWISNRYGMSIDNILALELVLPSGHIVNVTSTTYPDLFFGLKGGFNNFGIVTKFTMVAYPQGPVWGGLVRFNETYSDAIVDALIDYQETVTDPDASIISQWTSTPNGTVIGVQLFYNAAQPKVGVFDKFLAIPPTTTDIGTRSFMSFLIANSADLLNQGSLRQVRGRQNSARVPKLTKPVLQAGINITKYLGNIKPFATKNAIAATAFEPLLARAIIRNNLSATAYPHDKYTSPYPIYYFWTEESDDNAGLSAIQEAGDTVQKAVVADGQDIDGVVAYSNYASDQLPLEDLFSTNLPRLKRVAAKYDPKKLMTRTGGYKFQ